MRVWVDEIAYTGGGIGVKEQWRFTVGEERIDWQIRRTYLNSGLIEDTYFPGWDFTGMDTWTGGLLDTGGVAWCRYLPPGCSYGAHTGEVTFFNPGENACLRVTPTVADGTHVASRFSHQPSGLFSFAQSVTGEELGTRQNLCRFTRSLGVWAPFQVEPGTVEMTLTLRVLDDEAVRGRGDFAGLDGGAIVNLLDTIGRYGVVDRRIMGGNGWLTGWVCLHEPFFAQMGLAIGDPAYTANLAATLDDWRDLAMTPEGRVLSRWHHDTGDNMVPGTYNPRTGYYECGWGYTLDSQPDYVINVSEEFDLTGDLAWLRGHKESCERALDWLLARDSDQDGLVEMMTDSHTKGKASDWIDIVWASWENSFVNAALYEALTLWSERERILGDTARAERYRAAGAKLREAYCRPIDEGGFWDPQKGWFVYWREPDNSIHGDNLVTPVNFAAVAYGLADAEQSRRVLEQIETRMRAEKLFFWPLCFESYRREEVHANNWPFPRYENGDIFLPWGELGVRAYAGYDRELALAYVKRVLDRYQQDGLSYQRYLRNDQRGAGDDILAGNCMTIVGLYRDIFGIRPQWNRLRLDPRLTPELAGTQLRYRLRQKRYGITLEAEQSVIATDGFRVRAEGSFAVDVSENRLSCFQGDHDQPALMVTRSGKGKVEIEMSDWPDIQGGCRWRVTGSGSSLKIHQEIRDLQPNANYQLEIGGMATQTLRADTGGGLMIDYTLNEGDTVEFVLRP